MRTRSALLTVVPVLGLILSSCSSTGPRGPQAGTPGFYWAAANESYKAGDFEKTISQLDQAARTENEFTARARVWSMMISSGMARACYELAEVYDLGGKIARNNPMPFRKQASQLRTSAGTAALQAAEAFHQFNAGAKTENIAMDFPLPGGSATEPPELKKISGGILIPEAELELLKKTMIRRGVLMSVADAAGASGNTARAEEMFQKGDVQVAAPVLRTAMAGLLHDSALVFGPAKLDQPNRVKMILSEAMDALNGVPPGKETKEITAKIQKTMKKSRIE